MTLSFVDQNSKSGRTKQSHASGLLASKYSQFFIFLILFLQNERVKRKSKKKKNQKSIGFDSLVLNFMPQLNQKERCKGLGIEEVPINSIDQAQNTRAVYRLFFSSIHAVPGLILTWRFK